MNNYDLNTNNSNIYKLSFRGKIDNSSSNPINKSEEMELQRELVSKEAAYVTKATAMAQVLTGNNLRYSTTPQDYTDVLIKQGKIPNKHFQVLEAPEKDNGAKFTSITELNSEGKRIKETVFCRDNPYSGSWNAQYFYNPKYDDCPYKDITYHPDGSIDMSNCDVIEKRISDSYGYRPDGSLEYYSDFKDGKGTKYSEDGKITTFDFKDDNGNFTEQKYREYQDFK